MDEDHVLILDCLIYITLLEMSNLHEVTTEDSPFDFFVRVIVVVFVVQVSLVRTLQQGEREFFKYLG